MKPSLMVSFKGIGVLLVPRVAHLSCVQKLHRTAMQPRRKSFVQQVDKLETA